MRLIYFATGILVTTGVVVACGTDLPAVGIDDFDASVGADAGDAGRPAVDAGDAGTPATATHSIGGTVAGLSGTGLVLQLNGGDDLAVGASGTFTFPTKLAEGASYDVSVKTQPSAPTQTCTIAAGSGTVGKGDVTAITVNCAANKFTVGGTVSGLAGSGLVLQNNAGDDVTVNGDGSFAFPTPVASGTGYAVTVKTQPGSPSQTCVVTDGSGTIGAAAVTNVSVVCTTNKYKVGGTVTGLNGTGLALQLNAGAQTFAVAADGTFQFANAIDSGATYDVTVSAQPSGPSQTCTVSGGSGTVGAADVSSVTVNCATNKFTISGTASGLLGTATLQNNGADDLSVSANGTFSFATTVESGAAYAVTIKDQPGVPSQTCTLTNDSGTVGGGNVTDIALSCVTNQFKVKAAVTGLSGAGLVIQNNLGDDISVSADGTVEFATSIASGQPFAVTVSTQPTGPSQTCSVSSGTGTIGASDVTATIDCTTNAFTVGGSVSGLTGTGLTLQNNAGDDIAVGADGNFAFPSSVLSGNAYAVTVKTQPSGPSQTCTVSAGTGTVTNGNVVSVLVNCSTDSFSVGGSVSGLAGTGLVLQNNLGNDLTINNNGSFSFSTPVLSGGAYSVSVKTQPTNLSQTCTVTNGSGNVGGGPVTTISVSCVTKSFTVGGSVTGLTATGLVLQNNGGNDLTLNASGSFTFSTPILSGATYNVTVKTNPSGLTCTVASGSGTVTNANIGSVAVTCNPCGGYLNNGGCWYVSASTGQSCNTVCASHGGFDAVHAKHTGNPICTHFFPAKANGSNWVETECCSTDNNTNWGANGNTPDPNWTFGACYVACACNQ